MAATVWATTSDKQDHYELQNYTSVLEGKHMFKFGGRLRAERDSSNTDPNFNGPFTFNSLTAYQITEQGHRRRLDASPDSRGRRRRRPVLYHLWDAWVAITYYDVGLYFSDDWRWKPNFTVSYGLRFETQTDIHDNGDLAPRVSFAWGLGKGATPKTVLRAGWGMFYDRFEEQYVLQADRLNGTTQQQYIVDQPDFYPFVPPAGQPVAEHSQDISNVVRTRAQPARGLHHADRGQRRAADQQEREHRDFVPEFEGRASVPHAQHQRAAAGDTTTRMIRPAGCGLLGVLLATFTSTSRMGSLSRTSSS